MKHITSVSGIMLNKFYFIESYITNQKKICTLVVSHAMAGRVTMLTRDTNRQFDISSSGIKNEYKVYEVSTEEYPELFL